MVPQCAGGENPLNFDLKNCRALPNYFLFGSGQRTPLVKFEELWSTPSPKYAFLFDLSLRKCLKIMRGSKKFSKGNPEFKNHSKINTFYIITIILDRCCVDTRCFEVQMCRFHAHFFSYRCPTSDYAVLLAKSWLWHSRGIFDFYQSFMSVICFHRHDSQTKQRRVLESEL